MTNRPQRPERMERGDPFGDHDRREVGVRRRDVRHDRRVADARPATPWTRPAGSTTAPRRPHPAGADRMVVGAERRTKAALERVAITGVVAAPRRAPASAPCRGRAPTGAGSKQSSRGPDPLDRASHVARIAKPAEFDPRCPRRVRGLDRQPARECGLRTLHADEEQRTGGTDRGGTAIAAHGTSWMSGGPLRSASALCIVRTAWPVAPVEDRAAQERRPRPRRGRSGRVRRPARCAPVDAERREFVRRADPGPQQDRRTRVGARCQDHLAAVDPFAAAVPPGRDDADRPAAAVEQRPGRPPFPDESSDSAAPGAREVRDRRAHAPSRRRG